MAAQLQDPIIAIASAPGRAAVGIVRLSGKGLTALIPTLLGRTLQPRVATYSAFLDDAGQAIDHGLAIYFPAPRSFTGEEVLELQAHGGVVVLQMLLARCLAAAAQIDPITTLPRLVGLRLARPGEFSQRAFLNDKIDLTQAEAIADLIDASTEAAARSASRSLAGEFSNEIAKLRSALIQLRMLVEATLDFPGEEIDFLRRDDAQGQLQSLRQAVQAVQTKVHQGVLLREGIKVVIAGQPNAGKSSLLNALAQVDLAIVTPLPGTTRDTLEHTLQVDGVPLHVIDTAGLRESADVIEKIGVERAWSVIASADAVLFLHDLTRFHAADYIACDAVIARAISQKVGPKVAVVDLWSKADAVPGVLPQTGLTVSAKTGFGLDSLRHRLLELAGWQPAAEKVFMARERHVQALRRVEGHLLQASVHLADSGAALDLLAEELRLAQNDLSEITGEFTSDDLLGVIFSKFCIGK